MPSPDTWDWDRHGHDPGQASAADPRGVRPDGRSSRSVQHGVRHIAVRRLWQTSRAAHPPAGGERTQHTFIADDDASYHRWATSGPSKGRKVSARCAAGRPAHHPPRSCTKNRGSTPSGRYGSCEPYLLLSGLYRRHRNSTGSCAYRARGLSPPVGNCTLPRRQVFVKSIA